MVRALTATLLWISASLVQAGAPGPPPTVMPMDPPVTDPPVTDPPPVTMPGVTTPTPAAPMPAAAPPPQTLTFTDSEPSLFLGLTWTFGTPTDNDGKPGVTVKILSTNEKHEFAAMAGVTWNFDGSWGCDIGIAYNDDNFTLGGSYDICQREPQVTLGGTSDPDIVVITQEQ